MLDRCAFDECLRAIDRTHVQDVIAALEHFEDQFAPEHAEPGVIVLLNLLPDVPERQRGIFEMPVSVIVSRVVFRLIRCLEGPDAVEAVVRRILPELTSLSGKLELIEMVGFRDGVGHKLVSREAASEFEERWKQELDRTPVAQLVIEGSLLRVLLVARELAVTGGSVLDIDECPQVTVAILKAAMSMIVSQAGGNRAITRRPRLAWEALIELFGGEAKLQTRVQAAMDANIESARDVLELAVKYMSGWRPDDYR
jgi:hypothetical protein